ncbi:hypothetical protein XIS1_460007 [Xenorhabdus innexi]|uniref:Uncharacterized protein n=1 Tax=Xenorhabdus innexi TaxID=290109 RepID=A0A1N6MXZ8_9GAMM|nr:hypothetical protein Xinn_00148 [Xenorhabdus innexi]SIP73692.1 hypothetical protein XIS1_460007 [Xenorhabdus innexi]
MSSNIDLAICHPESAFKRFPHDESRTILEADRKNNSQEV